MSADIVVFPLARRRDLVWRYAEAMARVSPNDADQYLITQLEIVWNDLEQKGLPCPVIEREVIALGRAVRAELWHLILAAPGGGVA